MALGGISGRTAAALLLTVIALGVPFVFWYRTGWREAQREASRLEGAPHQTIRENGARFAEALGKRLEALRQSESLRPFYHYQSLYHDPQGASQGPSVLPSPLAQGPPDPMVLAHFQIDSTGGLSLPTLGKERLTSQDSPLATTHRKIREALLPLSPHLAAAARGRSGPDTLVAMKDPEPSAPPASSKIEKLKPEAYSQNVLAQEIYTQIQQGKAPPPLPTPVSAPRSAPAREVLIRVGSFHWHAVPWGEAALLLALREVVTPRGGRVQGFLVSPAAVAESLRGSPFPVRFLPGPPTQQEEVAVALPGASWRLAFDPGTAVAAARGQAEKVKSDFLRLFLGAAAAATVAAICLLLLFWQAERLARQRSRLAAAAAHELRTPLAGLRLYSEMLAEDLGDPARSADYASRISAEAERLGRVVSNLLGFSRFERGGVTVHPLPGDLGEAVRDAVERQRSSLEGAGLRLEVSIPEDLPPLRFDPDAVSQIVRNLLDNAEKHSARGEDRVVRVDVEATAVELALSVADNGPGLSPEVRRRLFHPFVRSTRSDAPEGLGLGLAIVKAFVNAHGGEVTAGDASGGGTIVKATFPLR